MNLFHQFGKQFDQELFDFLAQRWTESDVEEKVQTKIAHFQDANQIEEFWRCGTCKYGLNAGQQAVIIN
jgi:hypothetical protein